MKPNIPPMPRPCEAWKIKIGGRGEEIVSRKGTKFRPPVKWDHIKVVEPYTAADGQYPEATEIMAAVRGRYGDKPQRLDVWCPSDTPDDFCSSFYALYAGKRLACFGDGETCRRYEKTGEVAPQRGPDGKTIDLPVREWRDGACSREECPFARDATCKLHLKAAFQLREDLIGPVAILRSTSIMTHGNVLRFLAEFGERTGGVLRSVPLQLAIYLTRFGDHQVWALRLQYEGKPEDLARAVRRRRDLDQVIRAEAPAARLDLSPAEETPVEQAEVAEEFHPEAARFFDRAEEAAGPVVGAVRPEEEVPWPTPEEAAASAEKEATDDIFSQ